MSDALPNLADHTTPFLRNEWYVAALSSEITRELLSRALLNRSVLLFRKLDGTAVALRNLCPHRGFPLSQSRLEGDTITCGYHGLQFGSNGRCTAVPSQDRVPENLTVQSFPLVESGPYLWIWRGDPALADPADIPDHHWLYDPSYAAGGGYMYCRSSYIRLHENVLDLTHFPYVHGAHIGDAEYASMPALVEVKNGSVSISRSLKNRPVPGIFSMMIGNEGHLANRTSESWFISPGFHVSHATIEDLDGGVADQTDFHTHIIHCFTPATAHSCHYFFQIARDMNVDDVSVTEAPVEKSRLTFIEDEEAVEKIEHLWMSEDSSDIREMSVVGDRAGLRMRSIIARRAAAERDGKVTAALLPYRESLTA